MDAFPDRHPYRCLPLSIANSYGWEILCHANITIEYNGGPELDDIQITSDHPNPDTVKQMVCSNFSRGIVTFHPGYIFETEPGWDILATGSFNKFKDGMDALTGVIETDWLPYPFTMNWQMTRAGTFHFEKGEPFCQIFPVPHGVLENTQPFIKKLRQNPELEEQMKQWRNMRSSLKKRVQEGTDEKLRRNPWQRYYFLGQGPNMEKRVEHHVNKLRMAEPILADGSHQAKAVTQKQDPKKTQTKKLQHITEYELDMPFLYFEEFLSAGQCKALRDDVMLEQDVARSIMQQLRYIAAVEMGRFFSHPRMLFNKTHNISKITAQSLPEITPDPYSCIIFLGDDVGDMRIELKDQNIVIDAQPGLMLGFSKQAFQQPVLQIPDGVEQHVVFFSLTDDYNKMEESALDIYG